MHRQARRYVARFATRTGTIVELGSRDTSQMRVRDLFAGCSYVGVDASPGADVDIVVNAADWQPPAPVDVVVCCEVFEHSPLWREIIANAFAMLRPGGRAVFTCAGPGRAVHGVGHDDADSPGWYANLTAGELSAAMTSAGFTDVECAQVRHRSTRQRGSDIQATGVRP